MWIFEIATGRLYQDTDLETVFMGYSGFGDGKNNPAMQAVKNVGPIPVGVYDIGAPFDSPDHGPYCLRLTPAPENEMFGRDGFLVHGDAKAHLGQASEGCIVVSKPARMAVHLSEDRPLKVIAGGAS